MDGNSSCRGGETIALFTYYDQEWQLIKNINVILSTRQSSIQFFSVISLSCLANQRMSCNLLPEFGFSLKNSRQKVIDLPEAILRSEQRYTVELQLKHAWEVSNPSSNRVSASNAKFKVKQWKLNYRIVFGRPKHAVVSPVSISAARSNN